MRTIVIDPKSLDQKFNKTCLITLAEAKRICNLDKEAASTKDDYTEVNYLTDYLLCNVWLFKVDNVCESERAMYAMRTLLLEKGLLYTISSASTYADLLVKGEDRLTHPEHLVWVSLLEGIANAIPYEVEAVLDGSNKNADIHRLRDVLEALRFPKRYSPWGADKIADSSVKAFLDINRSNIYKGSGIRDLFSQESTVTNYGRSLGEEVPTTQPDDNIWFDKVRAKIQDHIRGTFLDLDYWKAKYGDDRNAIECGFISEIFPLCEFSNGTTYELTTQDKSLVNKLRQLKKVTPYYKDVMYPWSRNNFPLAKMLNAPSMLLTVPKSYKGARLILKQPAFRNFFLTGLRKAVTKQLKDSDKAWPLYNVTSQDRQRWRAFFGSVYGKYATLDLSSASDSISGAWGVQLFPIFSYIPWLRERFFTRGETVYVNHIFGTSGHPLTFLCETIFFQSVAEVATDEYKFWSDKRKRFLDPSTFGDDMIVDTRVFELVIDILTHFGCKVNVEKSFNAPSTYREACGEEYLMGSPMHTVKWPRTTFDWSVKANLPEYVASLLDLQHRICVGSDWRSDELLQAVVKLAEPHMTYSDYFSDGQNDIWTHLPLVEKIDYSYKIDKTVVSPKEQLVAKANKKSDPISKYWNDQGLVCIADGKLTNYERNHGVRSVYPIDSMLYAYEREVHMKLQSYYPMQKQDMRTLEDADLELALYVEFLINGPKYDSWLDEILHISTPTDRRALIMQPKTRWIKARA